MNEQHGSNWHKPVHGPPPRTVGSDVHVTTAPQQETLEAIRQLLDMFKMERLVYLAVTLLSVVVLLTCAMILLWKRTAAPAEIIGLFGSSGGIAYSTGRLLKMWDTAIAMLQHQPVPAQE